MISTVLLFALVSIATATDLTRHKIYNWTTYPGILLALVLNAAGSIQGTVNQETADDGLNRLMGWVGLEESLLGFLVCGFVMIVCFVFFRVGGGDVKLMAMVGAFLGVYKGIEALLWTFVLGGACGLIVLVWRVGLGTLLVRLLRQIVWTLRIRTWSPLTPEEHRQLQPPLFLAPSALAALLVMRWLPVALQAEPMQGEQKAMPREVLIRCLPWLALIVGSLVALRWLIVLSGARLQIDRLRKLHTHQAGSVQSLSFVLTLPIFIMFLMLIVQATQLMIGQVVVEYAAIAAARAAMVWVPAPSPDGTIPSVTLIPGQVLPSPWPLANEGENCISSISPDSDSSNSQGGSRYLISPGSTKFEKIRSAAILACLPIAPSRSVPQSGAQNSQNSPVAQAAPVLQAAYMAISPQSASNPKIGQRIANKLAYCLGNTQLQLTFVHKSGEPPLTTWNVPADIGEFYYNEVGWQDELQVTIKHQLALLPGPGRLLFGRAASPTGASDQVASQISSAGGDLYTYPLSASASLGNEGEKWVLSYVKHN